MAFTPALFLLGVPTTVTGFIDGGNTPIVFTSDDTPTVDTGDTAVVTVTVTGGTGDIDFEIVGGTDGTAFTIDDESGDLAFVAASVDGTYEVIVRAFSDWGSADQTITVTVSGGGSYHADAVRAAIGTYFETDSLVTSDSPLGLFSGWLNGDNLTHSGDRTYIGYTSPGAFWLVGCGNQSGSLLVTMQFWDTTNSVVFSFSVVGAALPVGWFSFQIAVDTNHGAGQKIGLVTINRVSQTVTVDDDSAGAFDIGWAQDDSTWINNYVDPTGIVAQDFADLYIAMGQFLDVSQTANINKFCDTDNKPISVGAGGSLPTGTAPTIFFSGDATTFGQPNLGTGGPFDLDSGPLTNASTSPSD